MFKILILCAAILSYEAANETIYSFLEMLGRNVKPPDIVEPLMLTISPKTWQLLDTEKSIINETIKSISFPEYNGELSMVRYKVWDAKIDSYNFSSRGISFEKFDNGIYLKIEGVKFHASAKVEVGIANSSWLQWLPLSSLRGGVNITSYNVELNAQLVWNNFTFAPNISMNSNIRLTFTEHFGVLNIVEPMLKETIVEIIDAKVAEKLNEAVISLVNPHVKQLKDKVSNAGYGFLIKGPIKWTVENNTLQITLRGGNKTVPRIASANKMVCVSADVVQLFIPLITSAFSGSRKRREVAVGLDFTCIEPVLDCLGTTCSVCTDVDIKHSSDGSPNDKYLHCIPQIDFMDWFGKNFLYYWNWILG